MKLSNSSEIYRNNLNGLLYLQNHLNTPDQKCNLYGEILPSFKNNISGTANAKEREIKLRFCNKKNYLPITTRFEGYSQFPRPQVKPLENSYMNLKSSCDSVLNYASKYFQSKDNKDLIGKDSLFYNKETLDRFNSALALSSDNDKKRLIELIDLDIKEFKEKNKYSNKAHFARVKVLKDMQERLKSNSGTKVINNLKFKEPNETIKKKHKLIVKGLHKLNTHLIEDLYEEHYKKFSREINKQFKSGPISRSLMHERLKSSLSGHEQIRELIKEIKEEDKTDDLDISEETECGKRYCEDNLTIKIKDLHYFDKEFSKEKAYLEGYKEPEVKEKGIVPHGKVKLKTSAEIYNEDMTLLKSTNPIAFEREKKKVEYDLKELAKKKKQREYFNKVMHKEL